VRAGGRQEKVEVGTIVVLDRQKAQVGETLQLPAVLLVDGDAVTSDAAALAKVSVTAEVLGEERGPKIVIQKFKNKTGYKKRQGHRQDLTRVKVTGIK
jgi:large subunit ribosomal protein L21